MSQRNPGPPSFSSFQSDKPTLHHINIDLLLNILDYTFLHPFFAWLLPLAYRAQTFQYHHPPFYWSAIYAVAISLLWIARYINPRIAFGPKRVFDWTEEVVVITGGASGLGLLVAEVYGMRGVSVAVLDVREPDGGEARNVVFYKCDVGDAKAVAKAAKEIERDLGTPTVLINNAAVVNGKSILELSIAEIEKNFQTNLLSHFYTIKQFLPAMQKSNRGSIITISSVLSHIGAKSLSDYSAAKAATRILHASLTAEVASYTGIKTLLVTPGQLSTPLFEGVETPSNFFAPVLEPVDVAKEIIAAIDEGAGGEIAMPAYSRWISLMGVLPVAAQKVLRKWSGVDEGMKGFVGRVEREKSDNDDE